LSGSPGRIHLAKVELLWIDGPGLSQQGPEGSCHARNSVDLRLPLVRGEAECAAEFGRVVGPSPRCRQIIRAPVPQVTAAVIHPAPGPQTPALVPRIPKPIPAAAHTAQQGLAPYPQAAHPVAPQSFYQSPTGVFHPGQMAGYFPPPPGQGLPPVHGGVPVQGVPQVTYPGQPAASGWIGRSSPTGQTPFPDRKEPIPSTSDVAANPVQRPRYAANPIPVRSERRPMLARLLIPLVFVAAALAVVFGLRKALQADQAAAGGLNPSLATEDPQVHAIISADAFCWDDNIPNKDKNLILKLMSRGNTREIARAYFSKQSKIGRMLESDLWSGEASHRAARMEHQGGSLAALS
jgi:hypothetical protein